MSVKIAVLVLNYNGKKHLTGFLKAAAFLQNEPEAEVVVVDNASCDDSLDFVRREFPWVHIVRNDSNYGWGEGYNVGIETLVAEGRHYSHYMFINNDVFPTKEWYERLLRAVKEAPPEIGEIGCRALFATRFIVEDLFVCAPDDAERLAYDLLPANEHSEPEVATDGGKARMRGRVVPFTKPVFSSFAKHLPPDASAPFAWYSSRVRNLTRRAVSLELPAHLSLVRQVRLSDTTNLLFVKRAAVGAPTKIELPGNEQFFVIRLVEEGEADVEFVQNSGIGINALFEGFDLHSYQPKTTPQDHGAVHGICGVCKIVKKEAFEAVRGFDTAYFMYYEDLDFSLRLVRQGYRFQVVEDAYLRHVHSGSSKAGSLFFWRQVAWSRFYFQYKHAGLLKRLRTWVSYHLRSKREQSEEQHWMSRVHTLVLDRFRREYARSYILGPDREERG